MQTKFSIISNNIFKYLIFFCISFIWCNFYFNNFLACVISSIIISSLVCFFLTKITIKKTEQKVKTQKEKVEARNVLTQLMFYTPTEQINFFYNVFKFSYNNVTKTKNGLVINKTLIVPVFLPQLLINDLVKIITKYKKNDFQKLIILTNIAGDDLFNFVNNFENINLKIIQGEDVYFKIIKPTKQTPKQIVEFKSNKKIKFKQLLQIALNKKNSKSYFLSGLFIMFASLFYRFSLYYQIFGTILFALSLFSYYNKPFNNISNTSIFE